MGEQGAADPQATFENMDTLDFEGVFVCREGGHSSTLGAVLLSLYGLSVMLNCGVDLIG